MTTYRLLLLRITLGRSSVSLLHPISTLRTPVLLSSVRLLLLTAVPHLTLGCAVTTAVARLLPLGRGIVVVPLLRRSAETALGLVLVVLLRSGTRGVSERGQ